ncbi:putative holin [Rhodoferax sp.]|uniref:putative holin n=1 Tax=Rhodoferax sp. TaxID=50421 RepID=UPI00284CF4E2|nr:putative holin [Rhodoferax sp.]MDR3370690.1 putative holin [Rhodoferax sp.]
MVAIPRMLVFLVLTLLLMALSLFLKQSQPDSLLAVTIYKSHLMALGGWGGYWLDRSLFPYDRPHKYCQIDDSSDIADAPESDDLAIQYGTAVDHSGSFGHSMLRRAIIVAACLICVGLGA